MNLKTVSIACALLLVGLMNAPTASAAAITCPFGSVGTPFSGGGCFSDGYDFAEFDFRPPVVGGGPYSLFLEFFDVPAFSPFEVTVTDTPFNRNAYVGLGRCVPIFDADDDCVRFDVTVTAGTATFSEFRMTVVWDPDTNTEYSNDPGDRIRLLHNNEGSPGPTGAIDFDEDITANEEIGSYCPDPGLGNDCEPPQTDTSHFPGDCPPSSEGCFAVGFSQFSSPGGDPAISGRDDNFSPFTVGQLQAVPEPATMLLLGTGLGALALRRRRP